MPVGVELMLAKKRRSQPGPGPGQGKEAAEATVGCGRRRRGVSFERAPSCPAYSAALLLRAGKGAWASVSPPSVIPPPAELPRARIRQAPPPADLYKEGPAPAALRGKRERVLASPGGAEKGEKRLLLASQPVPLP